MSSRLVTWKRIALVSSLAACLCSSAFADAISDAKAYAAKELQIKGNIVDEAANEKTLVMYNLVYPKGLDGVLDKFRTHFPFIKVTSFSLSGGALFERFRTEERSGRHTADIWQHSSPGSADILAEEKLLLDWTPPTDKLIDNKWKSKGHWYPVGLYHIGVAWNTKLVDAQTEKMLMGLKTWKDVAAVDWKEPIGFAHVRTGGTAYLPLYYLQKTFGEPYFEKLAAKKPMVLDSNVPLAERLADGPRYGVFKPVVARRADPLDLSRAGAGQRLPDGPVGQGAAQQRGQAVSGLVTDGRGAARLE